MNRPSRTEDDLEHPTWNQNPPFLAPDLTTRQDLNGIANARVQRSRCSAAGASALNEKNTLVMGHFEAVDAKRQTRIPPAMSGTNVPFIALKTALGGEGQARSSRAAQLRGWMAWVASVVVVSTFVSFVRDGVPLRFPRAAPAILSQTPVATAAEAALLRISRRQTACDSGGPPADYNMPLHVGALFIVLGVSTLACALPLLASKFPFLRIPAGFFFAIRHFGTGVLLATAFVHLLPTAFISLGDPCLSNFWTKDYPPMPGAIALIGIFLVTVIEMVFSPARVFSPQAEPVRDMGEAQLGIKEEGRPVQISIAGHCGHPDVAAAVVRPAHATRHDRRASIEPASPRNSRDAGGRASSDTSREASPSYVLTPEQQHKKSILQCMMLEVGILFHSVFIGMALSVAVGGDFVVLLIAIVFHQSFEGMALGARIASITWPEGSLQPWLMALAYGCTTPIGQAIGLATHQLYSPTSEFGLVLVGTMNAISSGLLVFASLIELLAEDFLSDHSWTVMQGKKRVFACFLVLLGSVLMSLVGAWA